MLCPRRKFLKVVGATALFSHDSACASHHIISSIKGVPYGNQKKWFTTIRQRPRRLVHRHGAHRSTVPGKRSGSRVRRERDVRAGCSYRVAHLVQSSPIKLACPGPTSSNGSVPVFGPTGCPGTQPPMVQTSQLWREY